MRTAPRQPPRTVASHSPTRAAQLRARLSGSMRHVRRLRLQPLMQAVATPTRKAATAPAVLAPSTQRTLSPGEGAVTSRFASGLPEGVVAEAATLSPTRPAESAVILVAEHVSEAGRAPEAAPDPQEASPSPSPPRTRRSRMSPEIKSLTEIRGVGQEYARLLHENGLTVEKLCKHYKEAESEETFKQLLFDTGLKHKRYVESIVSDISARLATDRLTICVEGNISAGKSTFLETARGALAGVGGQRRLLSVVPEPVDRWTHIPGCPGLGGGTGVSAEHNLLKSFYDDPSRWGFTFQNWVFFTRFMQERDSSQLRPSTLGGGGFAQGGGLPGSADVANRLMERSVFSDRLVFVQAMSERKGFSEMELAIYQQWWDFMLSDRPSLTPDGFIYLQASAKTCEGRMKTRNRSEEAGVPLEYLQLLEEKHEAWFHKIGTTAAAVLGPHGRDAHRTPQLLELDSLFGSLFSGERRPGGGESEPGAIEREAVSVRSASDFVLSNQLPKELHGQVIFMKEGTSVGGKYINRLPALVLDCEPDLVGDAEAKASITSKVKLFYEFVAKMKKELSVVASPHAPKPTQEPSERREYVERLERIARLPSASGVIVPTAAETRKFANA